MVATVRGISASGRSGSIDIESQREYTVTYLVYTNDRNDGPQQVRAAFGIPSIGDVYMPGNDYDASAIVTAKRVTQRDSPWEWEVEVTYSTDVGDEPDQPENPLDKPPEISWGAQERRIIVPGKYNSASAPNQNKDLELGIVAPNGELFDPQPEMDIAEPILTVTRNVASINAGELMALANCVNESDFYGAGKRELRLKPPQAQAQYDGQIGQYWKVTWQMVYKYDTWDIQVLNQGTYYLASNVPTPFKDTEGNRRIGLLSTDGTALNSSSADSAGRYIESGDAPTFTRLRVYREIDFNGLGII